MRLSEMLETVDLHIAMHGDDVTITGITGDSRDVDEKFLFAALPGMHGHGRDYITDALAKGASALLCQKGDAPDDCQATILEVDDVRRAYAMLAAGFYRHQPGMIAAVTGTNGKTSCVHFTRQIWAALGCEAASYGTLGIQSKALQRAPSLTTPDAGELHDNLAEMQKRDITHAAMEASSHGLDQKRLDGVQIKVAAFTNLSREHLDYHPDMQSYFDAKARLFTQMLPDNGTAVINADDAWGQELITRSQTRGLHVMTYGEAGEDLKLVSRAPRPGGQALMLTIGGQDIDVDLPLAGAFQAANALCALGMVIASGAVDTADSKTIKQVLEALTGAPGRLERVDGHPDGAAVYVDYAHAPGALETVLRELRAHADGKLICVVGCGGERDTGKREIMGGIAARLCDHVIITDDNPRGEDPQLIRQQMLKGAPEAEEIGDRAQAIGRAIAIAGAGDVVLLAGKGHEQGQVYADHTLTFDDRDVARAAMHTPDRAEPP